MWPHEVVNTAMGKLIEYKGISITLFISRYLAIMAIEKSSVHPVIVQHLLMGDAESYRWELVIAFHAIWVQQLEQGRVTWVDKDAKIKYRWALVWHQAFGKLNAASAFP